MCMCVCVCVCVCVCRQLYQCDPAVSLEHLLLLQEQTLSLFWAPVSRRRHLYTVCAGMKCVLFALLVLVCELGADVGKADAVCPQGCFCTAAVVDCSSRGLTTATLPSSFPVSTTELQLHDNHLTALPTGLLDGMQALQLVTLHGNPWECDCAVLYLRGWLLKQNNDALIRNVSCNSPPGLQGRLVAYLSEEEVLNTCNYWLCDLALASQISLFVFIVVQGILLAVVVYFLRRFNQLGYDAQRAAAESFHS
ncbi:platelet glycoprotein Ib beta chain [Pangasianodon hypophthalmus]|uniref:platelet glycoprotein Ib beta chain n=1 Tax=Pangasianodon hypophthalmus TaxID=310915 RepID=UPI0023074E62|nr:platelet glycoprotein Ib beta chain [Pangasianodon hypophthalmus]